MCKKQRCIPVAYMRQFLMIWANCTQYELDDLFESQFLFTDFPGNFHQTTLSRILQTLWNYTNQHINDNFRNNFCSKVGSNSVNINIIPYPELSYFYLSINERGFRLACPLFEKYFQSFPELKI